MSFNENAANLRVWNAVVETDPRYTKPITGRQFKGTALNPTYGIKKMTEHFGPVGWGWGYRIIGFEDVASEAGKTLTNHAHIEFWYYPFGREDEKEMRRASFEQVGATAFAGVYSSGKAFADDEARKKSVTDALLKAMSHVGIGGDIHLGLFDDTKYVEQRRADEEGAAAAKDTAKKEDAVATTRANAETLVQAIRECSDAEMLNTLRGQASVLRQDIARHGIRDLLQPIGGAIADACERLGLPLPTTQRTAGNGAQRRAA